jgi:hypothetical protein
LIKEPTRITDTTATLLDVAIVSKPDNICRSGVLHIGISDHSLIYVCRKISFVKKEIKIVNVRNYRNFNQQHLNDDLFHHLTLLNWEINKFSMNIMNDARESSICLHSTCDSIIISAQTKLNSLAPWECGNQGII